MKREVVARIRLDALRHNLAVVRKHCAASGNHSRVIAMVKADAYGHGLLPVARALGDADMLGVAVLEEALELRAGGIATPLVIMEGIFSADELRTAASEGFAIVVHQQEQIEMLRATGLPQRLPVWVKLDTGMHRLGLQVDVAAAALPDLRKTSATLGVMSHFACADEPGCAMTRKQLATLLAFAQAHELPASAANSGAIVDMPAAHLDVVRPGIMLYGAAPTRGTEASDVELQPAMTLTARVLAIKAVPDGDSVGYGAAWIARRDSRIGVIGIGYGDGYPRHAASGTPVCIPGADNRHGANALVPLAGRVSMDMITVDLSDRPDVRVGDLAVLWGDGLPADVVARHADTISYELFCRLTSRVRFEYVD